MVHDGHRQRLRERFLHEGIDSFAPHEVLELLLTYAIPLRDVNALAHTLINHFGSLHGVLDATPEQLMQVDGIGEYASTLLCLMQPLARRAGLSRQGKKPKLSNRKEAIAYCTLMLSHLRHEHFYVVALDAQMQLLGTVLISKGSLSEAPAYPRLVVEAVLKYNAHSVILCHNHPGGSALPSDSDLFATKRIAEVLSGIDVMLMDHVITAGSEAISLAQSGYIAHSWDEEDIPAIAGR